MSASPARLPRLSLYGHARRLLRQTYPDGREGPLPAGGHPLPDEPFRPDRDHDVDRQLRLRTVLEEFLAEDPADPAAADPERLRELIGDLDIGERTAFPVVESLPETDPARARALGLRLVRDGTDRRVVWVGLALLRGTAGPDEVPYIVAVGRLSRCLRPAAEVLASLDGTAGEIVRLAECAARPQQRSDAVHVLCQRPDPVARHWLRRRGLGPGREEAARARTVAEAADLPSAPLTDPEVLAHTGRLLATMAEPEDSIPQILRYADARRVLLAFSTHAASLEPTLDHRALLTSLLLDVHSGHTRLLDWEAGERELIVERLCDALWSWPEPEAPPVPSASDLRARTDRARAEWVARMRTRAPQREDDEPPAVREGLSTLRIEVTSRDPDRWFRAETRVLVDGRPVLGEALGSGPVHAPEHLLEPGLLRAGPDGAEPHEVQLLEALCTEPCCGALYAAISREGDTVVWQVWRTFPEEEKLQLRFDAVQYDAEVARAENDHSWEWPARTFTRLIGERLRAEPEVLGRWRCVLEEVGLAPGKYDAVRLTFHYPYEPSGDEGDSEGEAEAPWLRFGCEHMDNGWSPELQAERAVGRLARDDPKSFGFIAGGTRAHAEALGFEWPGRPGD
ncbi:hypothetical protein [Streptomyces sp. NPDC048172]|uniref:hypothetical protein n=1 Tax=Streptomyces sp. NPDC048172 TaxID=3365505 RepID=UPI00371DDBBB